MRSSKKLTKGLLPTLLCIVALLLTACGSGNSNGTISAVRKAPANKQIYLAPTNFPDIKAFDPALFSSILSTQSQAIELVYTGLVQLDDKQQIVDQLADSHSLNADGTTYTFKLKPNLKFSDGTPLTSADVVYSIDRALDPATKSPLASTYLALIKDSDKRLSRQIKTLIDDSLITPDPQTVLIKTTRKAAYFLYSLTPAVSFVIEKSLLQKYGSAFTDHLAEGGGDGPWKVARYIHGKEIDFVPNPYYYGPKPQLKELIMPFYQGRDAAYRAYLANQLDTSRIPTSAKALPKGQDSQPPILEYAYLTMNYLTSPFDNIKIRQAFALAINKDKIIHNIGYDVGIPSNHIVPQGQPGYNPNLTGPDGGEGTSGNPALAKQLFQQGLREEGLTVATLPPISITVAGGSSDVDSTITSMQQMWKNVLGVNVKIDNVAYNKLVDEVNAATNNPKGIQMWLLGETADYPDPQDRLTSLFDNGSAQNNMNYGQNKSADALAQQQNQKLMEQADANMDDSSRMWQYKRAEQQLVNDVAILPLYQLNSTYVHKACVVGITPNSYLMIPPDDWADIYKTTDPDCANVPAS